MSEQSFKVVLLGEGRVGKTSLVLRYTQGVFSDSQKSTIQATFLTKKLVVDDRRISLAIWDTAGQERFHALGPIYYRDANGALLTFDLTDSDSFTKVKNWVKELYRVVGKDIKLCIAGNKCDLERHRQVTDKQAEEYAASVGAAYFPTSAKLNKGVDDAFLALAKSILASAPKVKSGGSRRKKTNLLILDEDEDAAGSVSRPKGRRGVNVDLEEPSKSGSEKKGGCC